MAWSLLTPAWQAPDENAHFAYVQSIAERGELPGTPGQPLESSEQTKASHYSNATQAAGNPLAKMEWSAARYRRWRQLAQGLGPAQRKDGGGPNPAAGNPPLYYLAEVIPYEIARSGDAFTRLIALRLGSVCWLLVTCVGAWLVAREVFPRDRLLQVVATAVGSLLPMVDFASAAVGPDCLLYATWAFFTWMGVRILKRGLTVRRAAALGSILAAALLTKATSFALIPAAALVLVVAGIRRARAGRPAQTALLPVAVTVVTAAVPFGAWFLAAHLLSRSAAAQITAAASAGSVHTFNVREFLSYLWQYYLPRLPSMASFHLRYPRSPAFGLRDVWVDQAAGAFGWLEARWPHWVYAIWDWLVVAISVLVIGSLIRFWRRLDGWMLAFFAFMLVALLLGVHWTDYHFIVAGDSPFNQGRYIFALLPVAGIALAQGIALLRRGAPRRIAVGAVLAALFCFQVLSMGLVAVRFYA